MALSYDLISQFAKLAVGDKKTSSESTVYGTVVVDGNGNKYVKLDNSDQLTPLAEDNQPTLDSTTADANDSERVSVLIKDHTATVTGNISSPAARTGDVADVKDSVSKIQEFDILVGERLQANEAYIKELQTDKANVGDLTAATAKITELEASKASVDELNAAKAEITDLVAKKIDADIVNATYATIESLDATNAEISNLEADYGEFKNVTTDNFEAVDASIKDLVAKDASIEELVAGKASMVHLEALNAEIKLLEAKDASIEELVAEKASIEQLDAVNAEITNLDGKYANIDFANINEAAIKKIFSETGLIKDLVVGDSTITGELVGVTIKGDLIEGNTIKADKLVVKGSDGLYYKLNFESGTFTEGEEVPTDTLHGSIITANSITAEKISVKDLVAFGATIGGFHIGTNSIYSGVKSSVDNTTRGIYQDTDGQFAIGDGNNYIKYYKDSDGRYNLDISAKNVTIGSSNKNIEDALTEVQDEVATMKDEITTNLRIESSRGTVFKNDSVSTVLSVVIYRGSQRITDIDTLHSAMGTGAYLQWKWQRLDEDTFGVISASDSRLGNNGFTFTLSPEDVDTKVTFMCELIT